MGAWQPRQTGWLGDRGSDLRRQVTPCPACPATLTAEQVKGRAQPLGAYPLRSVLLLEGVNPKASGLRLSGKPCFISGSQVQNLCPGQGWPLPALHQCEPTTRGSDGDPGGDGFEVRIPGFRPGCPLPLNHRSLGSGSYSRTPEGQAVFRSTRGHLSWSTNPQRQGWEKRGQKDRVCYGRAPGWLSVPP